MGLVLVSFVSGVSVSLSFVVEWSSLNLTFLEEFLRRGLGLAGAGEFAVELLLLVLLLLLLLFLEVEEKKEGLLDRLEGLGLLLPESAESAPEDKFRLEAKRKNPSTILVTRTRMLSSPSTSTNCC